MKIKFLLKTLLTSLVFSCILFISAGKLNYIQGWMFLTINLITGFMNFWYIRNDEALMNERSKIGENAKVWDKRILAVSSLVYLLNVILAGLDSGRFQWTPAPSMSIYLIGSLIMISGQLIFLEARKQNRFFSSVVRIQTDREHQVCDSGLYSIIRHPGYLGMIVSLCAVPMITGSAWCSVTTGIAILLIILRTYLEDNTLKSELKGYTEYSMNTKYRLIPGIW